MTVMLNGQYRFTEQLKLAGERFWQKDFLGDRDLPKASDCEACTAATPTNPVDGTMCPLTCRVPDMEEEDYGFTLRDARGLAMEVTGKR